MQEHQGSGVCRTFVEIPYGIIIDIGQFFGVDCSSNQFGTIRTSINIFMQELSEHFSSNPLHIISGIDVSGATIICLPVTCVRPILMIVSSLFRSQSSIVMS